MTEKEKEDNQEKPTEGENKKDKKGDGKKKEEEQQVKKARKVTPKFDPSMLRDKQKGLEALFKRIDKLDSNVIKGDKEGLSKLMRVYQSWLFQLFSADFGDMCWKLGESSQVRHIVREFVFDKKGIDRNLADRFVDSFVDDEEENQKDGEEFDLNAANKPVERSRFLDDNDNEDDDDGILDLIGKETQ